MTFEKILARMLEKIPDTFDKREGSVIYNALSPAALEIAVLYTEIEGVLNESFGDTASREYLVRRASERGIAPYPATYAKIKGEFNVTVPVGSRFSLDGVNFRVTDNLSELVYELTAEVSGTVGNKVGTLVPVEYISGLEKALATEIITPARDEEETEDFRKRYRESLKTVSFGGNKQEYKERVESLDGVGKVYVVPCMNGNGTVGLVITDAELKKPTEALVSAVQETVDPVSGEGLGLAPVCHKVTVTGAEEEVIDIAFKLTYRDNYSFESVKEEIEKAVDSYLGELSESFGEERVVRVSRVEMAVLNVMGVLDVTSTTLNGVAENIVIAPEKLAVRGEISEES